MYICLLVIMALNVTTRNFITLDRCQSDYEYIRKNIIYIENVDDYYNFELWLSAVSHDFPKWDPQRAALHSDRLSEFEAMEINAAKLDGYHALFRATGDKVWLAAIKKASYTMGPLITKEVDRV